MTNANDPITMLHSASERDIVFNGLTKREYFAAMAMQGLLASMTEMASIGAWQEETADKAAYSVVLADALIAELSKEK